MLPLAHKPTAAALMFTPRSMTPFVMSDGLMLVIISCMGPETTGPTGSPSPPQLSRAGSDHRTVGIRISSVHHDVSGL